MRRLSFPYVMPYHFDQYVVTFKATAEAIRSLGEPSFVETDRHRTAGGREYYWAFERDDGLRFEVIRDENLDEAQVFVDPPEPKRAISALLEIGVVGPFETRELAPDTRLQPGQARGAVWLFIPENGERPTAVFSRKQHADAWLLKNGATGTLLPYPIDNPLYGAAKTLGVAELPPSEEAPRYARVWGEQYQYVSGKLNA